MSETMTSRDLIGRLVTIVVKRAPGSCRYPGFEPLEKTEHGRILAFDARWPGGPIGFLETDDERRVVFDAGYDIAAGKIEIEVADA